MTRLSGAIARNAPSVTYWRVMRNQYDMTSDMHACHAYVHCIPGHMTFRTVSTRPPLIAAFERNQFLSAMARMKDHYRRRNAGHEGIDGRAQRRLSLLTIWRVTYKSIVRVTAIVLPPLFVSLSLCFSVPPPSFSLTLSLSLPSFAAFSFSLPSCRRQ